MTTLSTSGLLLTIQIHLPVQVHPVIFSLLLKALDEGRSSGRAPLPSLFTVHHYAAIPQSTLFPAASPFAVPTIGTSATCYLRRATEDGFGATPSVPAVLVADPPPTPSYHTHSSYARQR